jgi:hypothetical protein
VAGLFPEATELQEKGSVGTVKELHRQDDYTCPKVDIDFKRPGPITGIPSDLLEHVGRLARFTQYVGRRHSKPLNNGEAPAPTEENEAAVTANTRKRLGTTEENSKSRGYTPPLLTGGKRRVKTQRKTRHGR